MKRARLVWVCAVLLSLILTIGTIEAGRVSTAGSPPPVVTGVPDPNLTAPQVEGGVGPAADGGSGGPAGAVPSVVFSLYTPPSPPRLNASDWPLYLSAVAFFAACLALALRSSGDRSVYDLDAALRRLEMEGSFFSGSASRKLRNEALLRYYSQVRKICGRLGIPDRPSDTPLEYLRRISETLGIDGRDAAGFADTFERSRYGVELSENEAKAAAASMAKVVGGLRGVSRG